MTRIMLIPPAYGCVGLALDALRKSKNTTKRAIADFIICSPSTVSSHIRGSTEPNLWYISKYCEFFGISLAELFHLMECIADQRISSEIKIDVTHTRVIALMTH